MAHNQLKKGEEKNEKTIEDILYSNYDGRFKCLRWEEFYTSSENGAGCYYTTSSCPVIHNPN